MKIQGLSVEQSRNWVQPRLKEVGGDCVDLTKRKIKLSGVYLLDNGVEIVVWIGKSYACEGRYVGTANEEVIKDIEEINDIRGSGGVNQKVQIVRVGSNIEKM